MEILVTLTTAPADSGPAGVRVSGRVAGVSAAGRSRLTIVIQGPSRSDPRSEVQLSADGTFEFSGIQPGAYSVGVAGPGVARDTSSVKSIVVAGRDMRDIDLTAVVQMRVEGQVVVLDRSGREAGILPRPASIAFVNPDTGGANVMVDSRGHFTLLLREGEYTMSLPRLPDGFSVKSISSGSTDLLKTPLKIEWTTGQLPVTVTIEYAP
jgi:hypothetical protein